MEHLDGLRIAPLRLRLETVGPFRTPEYKGALFRGGFGQFFRDLVCVTRAPVCTGCRHLETRSEEHTSELQSPTNLVCRLLLEKKKKDGYRPSLRAALNEAGRSPQNEISP